MTVEIHIFWVADHTDELVGFELSWPDTVPDDGPLDRTLVIVMTSGPLDLGGPDTDFYDTSEMMQRSTWNLPAAVKVVEKYDLRYRVCHIHHKLSSQ